MSVSSKAFEFGEKVGHVVATPIIWTLNRLKPLMPKQIQKVADWAERKHDERQGGANPFDEHTRTWLDGQEVPDEDSKDPDHSP